MVKMSELNEFFEQILHTERSLSSRNVKLRKLKKEIQLCVEALQHGREEAETRQGELAVRNVKMVDQEVEARLLELRRNILEEQRNKLSEENQSLTSDLEVSRKQLESDSELFLEELKEFGRSYDLVGSGYQHREEQTQKRIRILQDEVLLLEAELTEFDDEGEEVKKLERQLVAAESTLKEKREQKTALENQVLSHEAEAKQLEEEKRISGSRLSADPEIVKLQKELEECRDCPEERMYHSLCRELEDLQRLCYHKQMRQQLSLQKKRESQGGNCSKSGIGNRSRLLLNHDQPRRSAGHYNPYTHQYVPSTGIYGVGSEAGRGGEGEGKEDAVTREEGEEEEEEEEAEGWDDELEKVDEDFVSMEWGGGDEEEREGEGEREEDKEEESRYFRNMFEPIVPGELQLKKRGKEQKQTLSRAPTNTGSASRSKYSFKKPSAPLVMQSTPKAIRTVVKRGSRQAGVTENATHLSSITDSPLPGETVPRKSSGQSIYKAPGQHEPLQGLPKTAKRVRFRY